MTVHLPRGSGPQDEDPDAAAPATQCSAGSAPVAVVVSAPWAGPSRPAPTVLRELARRWGTAVQVLIVEEPSEDLLEHWQVDVLPTWLRFLPAATNVRSHGAQELILDELAGTDLDGADVTLTGPWELVHRRTGAQPKHLIDAEFGPGK